MATTDASLPWLEKYRPVTLGQVLSQEAIIATLQAFIRRGELPHLLFYGPPGTGKTSTILAAARAIYGDDQQTAASMTLCLNASDDRGIDVVRDQIKAFASTKNFFNTRPKLLILDEADSMTAAAQAALRRIVERYVANVRFCFICNYVGGIIPALQSRCTRFRFAPMQPAAAARLLEAICVAEGVEAEPAAIGALCKLAGGDMRRAINTLQSAAAAAEGGKLREEQIYQLMAVPTPAELERCFGWLQAEPFDVCFGLLRRLLAGQGYCVVDVVRRLFDWLIDVRLADGVRTALSRDLAAIEHSLNKGCNETIQLAALVAAFHTATKALQ